MNTQSSKTQQTDKGGCGDCEKDQDNETQKSINKERVKICDSLYDSLSLLSQQETKVGGDDEKNGERGLYKDKRCLYINTEENYRYFRNLDISIGTEILQTNELTKINVDNLKKWNTDLNSNLKKLVSLIKDTKGKFAALADTSCSLSREINSNNCNSAQWKAITGKMNDEKCNDDPLPNPPCGETAEKNFKWLTCMPNGLVRDIDYIFQSSADVVGIQIFSNIDTLEPLQKNLTEQSKTFEKSINDIMKSREDDLKKLQEDLIKSVKTITQSVVERNNLRSNFEAYYDSVKFLCCPACGCVITGDDCNPNECDPRLENCKECICNICKDVKKSFCCDTEESGNSGCKN